MQCCIFPLGWPCPTFKMVCFWKFFWSKADLWQTYPKRFENSSCRFIQTGKCNTNLSLNEYGAFNFTGTFFWLFPKKITNRLNFVKNNQVIDFLSISYVGLTYPQIFIHTKCIFCWFWGNLWEKKAKNRPLNWFNSKFIRQNVSWKQAF